MHTYRSSKSSYASMFIKHDGEPWIVRVRVQIDVEVLVMGHLHVLWGVVLSNLTQGLREAVESIPERVLH